MAWKIYARSFQPFSVHVLNEFGGKYNIRRDTDFILKKIKNFTLFINDRSFISFSAYLFKSHHVCEGFF